MPTPTLAAVLRSLRSAYGVPAKPISTDPFHLILWEQVAYLVPDSVRAQAYHALKTRVGLKPAQIVAATPGELTAITRVGGTIAAVQRAGRIRQSAELVLGAWSGKLSSALNLPAAEARRALAKFPMIGEPGADRILAIARGERVLPLDSNGLRVLERLGVAPGGKDYRRAYRSAQDAVLGQLPRTADARVGASILLRHHGQTVCRRSRPRCPQCVLLALCPSGQGVLRGT